MVGPCGGQTNARTARQRHPAWIRLRLEWRREIVAGARAGQRAIGDVGRDSRGTSWQGATCLASLVRAWGAQTRSRPGLLSAGLRGPAAPWPLGSPTRRQAGISRRRVSRGRPATKDPCETPNPIFCGALDMAQSVTRATHEGSAPPASPVRPATAPEAARSTPLSRSQSYQG